MSSDGFFITEAIMGNPKLLRCSGLARQIYWAMIFKCDHEGRGLADAVSWMQHAALFGRAAATIDEVEAALAELSQERLAPRYVVAGKAYVFLPGRFEHNGTRKYWRRSACPLPPAELLSEFPEYALGLALLTTKSELRRSLRGGEARRYPQFAHIILESGGQQVGNDGSAGGMTRESSVLSSSIVLGKEGDLPRAEEEAPGAALATPTPEPPPCVADAPEARRDPLASPKQQRFAARLLAKHGLSLPSWLENRDHDELLDSDVDEIRAAYGRDSPPDGKAEVAKRNARLADLRDKLRNHYAAGHPDLRGWIKAASDDQHFEFQLLVLLRELQGGHDHGEATRPPAARDAAASIGEWT